jgi:hypothetical protein
MIVNPLPDYHFLAGIFLTIASWVQKIGFKKRLSKGLGRSVSDQELVSISTWMRVDEKEVDSSPVAPHPKLPKL